MTRVLQVENVSKRYRLGQIGASTLREDVNRWISKWSHRNASNLLQSECEPDREVSELWALRNISFNVDQGDILGVIGHNGAGKSTLLKILSRITTPTEGLVGVKGRIGSLLEVGTGFHPELSGLQNIYLNGSILGMSKSEITSKLDEIIDFAGMARFIDTPAKRYSSGMTVRLAFAVAAHLDPEILIFDEVLAVGDAAFQAKCIGKMRDVADEGRTVLFVSHNLASIQNLCTRAIWLSGGQLLEDGTTTSVVKNYEESLRENKFDRADISNRMDVIEGIEAEWPDSHHSAALTPGQLVNFRVKARVRSSYKRISISIGIYDNLNRRLCLLDSEAHQLPIDAVDGRVDVTCRIERLPLLSGSYFLNVALTGDGHLLDVRERAYSLYVTQNTDHIEHSPRFGPLLMHQQWFVDEQK